MLPAFLKFQSMDQCKWSRLAYLIAAFLLLLSCFEKAKADIQIPRLSSSVIDAADFVEPPDELRISAKIKKLYDAGGPQFQIWTVPSLEGEPIESLSMRAVDAWKLGRAGKDDGLLLLIARQERRFRLEVGRGLEGVIPDALSARILRNFLQPALRKSAAALGVERVLLEVARLTLPDFKNNEAALTDGINATREIPFNGLQIFFFLIVLFIIVSKVFANTPVILGSGRGRYRGGWSGGSGGGWSGGSGGGWSGGGGGFSGGGSSGGW